MNRRHDARARLEPGSGSSASGDAPELTPRGPDNEPPSFRRCLDPAAETVAHAVILAILSGLCPVAARAGGGMPTVVKVQRDETGYHLLRDGRPYTIKGGGGRVYLEALKEAGGNSLRTWGEDDLEPLLDRRKSSG